MTKLDDMVSKLAVLETKQTEGDIQRGQVIIAVSEIKLLLQALSVTVVRMEATQSLNHQANQHKIETIETTLEKLEPIVTVHEQERQQGQGKKNMIWAGLTVAGSAITAGIIHWITGR